jgi:hypothetical protein
MSDHDALHAPLPPGEQADQPWPSEQEAAQATGPVCYTLPLHTVHQTRQWLRMAQRLGFTAQVQRDPPRVSVTCPAPLTTREIDAIWWGIAHVPVTVMHLSLEQLVHWQQVWACGMRLTQPLDLQPAAPFHAHALRGLPVGLDDGARALVAAALVAGVVHPSGPAIVGAGRTADAGGEGADYSEPCVVGGTLRAVLCAASGGGCLLSDTGRPQCHGRR